MHPLMHCNACPAAMNLRIGPGSYFCGQFGYILFPFCFRHAETNVVYSGIAELRDIIRQTSDLKRNPLVI